MKELIKCLIDFGTLYNVDVSVSIITSDNKTETFITIRLTNNNYRVIKCIEYKQFEQLTNQHLYYILLDMVHQVNSYIEQDKE